LTYEDKGKKKKMKDLGSTSALIFNAVDSDFYYFRGYKKKKKNESYKINATQHMLHPY
jgi:hypothetical protein